MARGLVLYMLQLRQLYSRVSNCTVFVLSGSMSNLQLPLLTAPPPPHPVGGPHLCTHGPTASSAGLAWEKSSHRTCYPGYLIVHFTTLHATFQLDSLCFYTFFLNTVNLKNNFTIILSL